MNEQLERLNAAKAKITEEMNKMNEEYKTLAEQVQEAKKKMTDIRANYTKATGILEALNFSINTIAPEEAKSEEDAPAEVEEFIDEAE